MKEYIRFLIATLIIIFFIFNLKNLKIEESPERWIPEGSKEIEYYKNFLKKFKSDAILILSFEGKKNEIKNELKNLKEVKIFNYPLPFIKTKKKIKIENTFIITYKPKKELNPVREDVIKQIKKIFESKNLNYHLAGTGVIFTYLKEKVRKEAGIIFSISFFILLILIIIILKNLKSILLTITVSLGGLLTMLFIAVKFKIPLGSLSLVLLPIILFYSSTLCFHIIHEEGKFKEIKNALFFATLTTIFGFTPFLFSKIELLKDFSKLAISGISGSFIFSLILFYPELKLKKNALKINIKISKIFIKRKELPLILLLISFSGIFLFKKLKIETNTLKVLPQNSKPVIDHKFIEENVGYYIPIEYVFPLKTPSEKIKKFIREVFKFEEVSAYISPYNFYPLFMNPQKAGYISKDKKYLRVTFFIKLLPTLKGIEFINKINKIADSLSIKNYRVTGYVAIYAIIAHFLSKTFIKSLIIAFSLIFLIFFLYFRNLKIFISSLISNSYPVIMLLSFMSLLKIPLDIFTIPIVSLLLGIVVDDTFYILYFLKKEKNIQNAYSKTESPGFLTSFILFTSFLILLFSSLPPVKNFGILCSLSIMFAYIGDFVILPAILEMLKREKT